MNCDCSARSKRAILKSARRAVLIRPENFYSRADATSGYCLYKQKGYMEYNKISSNIKHP
jgi:hypothetical protein